MDAHGPPSASPSGVLQLVQPDIPHMSAHIAKMQFHRAGLKPAPLPIEEVNVRFIVENINPLLSA
jgi:hypothetical protein